MRSGVAGTRDAGAGGVTDRMVLMDRTGRRIMGRTDITTDPTDITTMDPTITITMDPTVSPTGRRRRRDFWAGCLGLRPRRRDLKDLMVTTDIITVLRRRRDRRRRLRPMTWRCTFDEFAEVTY